MIWLFLSTIVVSTLIFFTDLTRNPYLIQERILQIFVLGTMLLWFFSGIRKRKSFPPATPLGFPFLLFLFICLISSARSFLIYPDWKWSIFSFSVRNFLFLLINVILVYYLTLYFSRNPRLRKKVIYALILSATLASLYAISQYLGWEPFWPKKITPYGTRAVSTLGNPNFLSSCLLVSLLLSLSFYLLERKLIWLTVFLINFFALLITRTRSSWAGWGFGFVIFIFGMYILERGFLKKNAKRILALILGMVILMSAFPYLSSATREISVAERVTEVFKAKGRPPAALTQRIMIWGSALDIFRKHPLLGCGWGNFEILYPFYQGKYLYKDTFRNLRTHANNVHNEILEIASQVGIVGLGIYIWLFIVFFSWMYRVMKRANQEERILLVGSLCAISSFLVDNLLNVSLHFPIPALFFWSTCGIAASFGSGKGKSRAPIFFKISSPFLLLVWIGVIIFNGKYFMNGIYHFKALKERQKGNLSQASDLFRRAWKVYPLDVNNNYDWGNVLAQQQKIKKAEWAYEQAIRANPGYDEVYYNLGVVLKRMRNLPVAEKNLRKSLEINPTCEDAWLALAHLYIEQRRVDEGFNTFRESLKANPKATRLKKEARMFWNQEGQRYIKDKNWQKADEVYQTLLHFFPEEDVFRFYLANVYFQLGKIKDSIPLYKELTDKRPEHSGAWLNLGLAYIQLDKKEEAKACFQKVLKTEPQNKFARQKLFDLTKR